MDTVGRAKEVNSSLVDRVYYLISIKFSPLSSRTAQGAIQPLWRSRNTDRTWLQLLQWNTKFSIFNHSCPTRTAGDKCKEDITHLGWVQKSLSPESSSSSSSIPESVWLLENHSGNPASCTQHSGKVCSHTWCCTATSGTQRQRWTEEQESVWLLWHWDRFDQFSEAKAHPILTALSATHNFPILAPQWNLKSGRIH